MLKKTNKKMTKKQKILLLIMLIALLLLGTPNVSSEGKGEIEKVVLYENEDPIVGAEVYIPELDISQYTGDSGIAEFLDVPGHAYYTIWVDIDLDGVWDGEEDYIWLPAGGFVQVINFFPTPTSLGTNKIKIMEDTKR